MLKLVDISVFGLRLSSSEVRLDTSPFEEKAIDVPCWIASPVVSGVAVAVILEPGQSRIAMASPLMHLADELLNHAMLADMSNRMQIVRQ